MKPLKKKSIYIKLLLKLTKQCVFAVNNRLIKQMMVAQMMVLIYICLKWKKTSLLQWSDTFINICRWHVYTKNENRSR